VVDTSAQLTAALAPLPVSVLDWEQALLDRLEGMGIRRLGDLLRLPRDGLARRFGPQTLLYLDRMLGRCPHPQRLYQPQQVFTRRVQLPTDITQAQALLFALQRLLLEMCGWLQGQGAAVQRVDICLLHHEQDASRFSVGVYHPTRDAEQLTALLRERIERLELQAPVHSVELHAGETVRHDARSQDLFDRSDRSGQVELLDRLRARLGDSAVTGLSAVAEHRPEYAWRYKVRAMAREGALWRKPPGDSAASSEDRQRPLWLLSVPRKLKTHQGHPQLQGRLQLHPDRERIESGWWDEHDVARDYYIATSRSGSCYWIYRELTGERGWYLQGVFE
jgi:protein ImuB